MSFLKRDSRQHPSGNSVSVRLPRGIAYDDPRQPVELERRGDEITIRPKRAKDWAMIFAEIDARRGPGLTDEALVRAEMPDRPWYRD